LKTQAEDGSWIMEYRNIRQEAPSASLFEIPQGYQKLAMPMAGLPGMGQSPHEGLDEAALPDIQELLRQMGQNAYIEEE
jgi:hypothetical protein